MYKNESRNFNAIEELLGKKIAKQFYAYTHFHLKRLTWGRGKNTEVYRQGKEEWDYMFEAVARYLEHPEKFNPQKANLLKYLINTVKTIISSDVRAEENQTTLYVDAIETEGTSEDEKNSNKIRNLEKIYPREEPNYDEAIDHEIFMIRVRKEIAGDKILEKIFEGYIELDLPRRDVIKKYNLSDSDYDNGIRRLETIRTKVKKIMNIE